MQVVKSSEGLGKAGRFRPAFPYTAKYFHYEQLLIVRGEIVG